MNSIKKWWVQGVWVWDEVNKRNDINWYIEGWYEDGTKFECGPFRDGDEVNVVYEFLTQKEA